MHRLIGAATIWFAGIHIIYFGMIFNGASRYPRNPVWALVSGFVAAEIFLLKLLALFCAAWAILFVAVRIFSSATQDTAAGKIVPGGLEEGRAALKAQLLPIEKTPKSLATQSQAAKIEEPGPASSMVSIPLPPSPEEIKRNALKQLLRRGS